MLPHTPTPSQVAFVLGGHKGVWVALVFVVETGSPSGFLNWCDCVCVGGGERSRDGGEERLRREGELSYCIPRWRDPGFLERLLAGWRWAGFTTFRWAFLTVLSLYS